jgi:serine phosphatase RsbU (regulator of sigma subunit)
LFSHATSDAPTVALPPGAVLLLVSRGVVEGKCKEDKNEDQEYGLDRVKQHLREETSGNAQTISASILKAVSEFTCAPLAPDDMTALVFVRDQSVQAQ